MWKYLVRALTWELVFVIRDLSISHGVGHSDDATGCEKSASLFDYMKLNGNIVSYLIREVRHATIKEHSVQPAFACFHAAGPVGVLQLIGLGLITS